MLADDATVIPAVGHYWFAPVLNAAIPDDVMNPPAPWMDCGHTQLEDPFAINRDGGDTNTKGTWQNPRLRNQIETFTDAIAFVLQQWSHDQYRMYFGQNSVRDGRWTRTPSIPVELQGSLFVVVVDGDEHLPMYSGRVSVGRADDIEFDAEEFAGLPVRATLLDPIQLGDKGDWTAQTLAVAPTSVTDLTVGATQPITATVTRRDSSTADVTAAATWSSDDDQVAAVAAGNVTGVAAGDATITATYAGLTADVDVTVAAG